MALFRPGRREEADERSAGAAGPIAAREIYRYRGCRSGGSGDRGGVRGYHRQPPFALEGLATVFDFGCGVGIDHVAVILGEFVLHAFRGMAEKIAVLVNRAALDR